MSGLSIFGNWISGVGGGICLAGLIAGIPLPLSVLGLVLASVGLICVAVG